MKTIRLFGIALITVLMGVSFSACGGSDDDDNGGGGNTSVSIEGLWYYKNAVWYRWDSANNKPGEIKETYNYEGKNYVMTLTKNGKDYTCNIKEGSWTNSFSLIYVSGNEYYTPIDGEKIGRWIIKSVTEKQLVVEEYETYYLDKDHPGYGVLTYTR